MNVVLPAPDGPITATREESLISPDTMASQISQFTVRTRVYVRLSVAKSIVQMVSAHLSLPMTRMISAQHSTALLSSAQRSSGAEQQSTHTHTTSIEHALWSPLSLHH